MLWFFSESLLERRERKRPPFDIFPDEIKNSKTLSDSLKKVQDLVQVILSKQLHSAEREIEFIKFKNTLSYVNSTYMEDKGLLHAIKSRGKSFTVFFYQPVQLPIKKENNFVFKIFAFLNIVCNVIFITFSLFISVIFLRKINRTYLLFLIPNIFLLLLFVFYFVLLENRELFCLLPMFILASSNAVKQIRLNFIPKKILYCVVSVIVLLLSVFGYYVGSLAY